MKKVKISNTGTYKDNKGKTFHNYKIFLFGRGFWLSELDFHGKEALKVEGNFLHLKEPLEKYYFVAKKMGNKGRFYILKPALGSIEKPKKTEVEEPEIEYQRKSQAGKKINNILKKRQDEQNEKHWELIKSKKADKLDSLFDSEKKASAKGVGSMSLKGLDPSKKVDDKELINEIRDDFSDLSAPKTKNKHHTLTTYDASLTASPASARLQFFQSLLQMGSRKNINEKTRERLLELVGREMERENQSGVQILKAIEEIKAKLTGSTFKPSVMDSNEETTETVDSLQKTIKFPHLPKSTFNFLRFFKHDNDTGLKELVHLPSESEINYGQLLEKVKNHPVFSYEYGHGRKEGFEPVQVNVRQAVNNIIYKFEKVISINNYTSGKHPIETDYEFKIMVQEFKRNYRFGPISDNYSNLKSLIEIVARGCLKKFPYELKFNTQRGRFDNIATFFSWSPNLESALRHFFNEITENSNIDGKRDFTETKQITVEALKNRNSGMIEISIRDERSIANKDEYQVLTDLRNSPPMKYLDSLCNWSVLLDNNNGSFELFILSDNYAQFKTMPIVKQDKKINAFEYKLSFYYE